MLLFQQVEFLTYDRQEAFMAEAEQWRLEQSLAPSQPHPLLAWAGQQLVALGRRLQSERRAQVFTTSQPR
jgi:hypothetical protein